MSPPGPAPDSGTVGRRARCWWSVACCPVGCSRNSQLMHQPPDHFVVDQQALPPQLLAVKRRYPYVGHWPASSIRASRTSRSSLGWGDHRHCCDPTPRVPRKGFYRILFTQQQHHISFLIEGQPSLVEAFLGSRSPGSTSSGPAPARRSAPAPRSGWRRSGTPDEPSRGSSSSTAPPGSGSGCAYGRSLPRTRPP